ncbi:MAG: hypothetical protein RLZZ292_3750, partial [Bacteroidota bacterium]
MIVAFIDDELGLTEERKLSDKRPGDIGTVAKWIL